MVELTMTEAEKAQYEENLKMLEKNESKILLIEWFKFKWNSLWLFRRRRF